MATITLNIPDAQLNRVVNGLATLYGYQATVNGEPNPQTKAQFAKAQILRFVKESVKAVEANADAEAARTAAVTKAETEITLS